MKTKRNISVSRMATVFRDLFTRKTRNVEQEKLNPTMTFCKSVEFSLLAAESLTELV